MVNAVLIRQHRTDGASMCCSEAISDQIERPASLAVFLNAMLKRSVQNRAGNYPVAQPAMTNLPPIPGFDGLMTLSRREGVDIRPTLLRVLTDLYVQTSVH